MTMMHPGLPQEWILVSACFMAFVCIYAVLTPLPTVGKTSPARRLSSWPLLAPLAHWVTRRWLLTLLRIVLVAVFLLVIVAGLFGTPIAERNMATTVTWTLWWSGVVLSVLFFGSAWCAVCPWDTLAGWLVKSRFWGKGAEPLRLNIRVPIPLRNIVPAILLFIGLSWLELGVGVAIDPYATALLALAMVVMSAASMAIYERKAFCRYFCPVGRTIGAYSQLSPIALGPIDSETCRSCQTLSCYYGTKEIEPCPTHLVVGRIKQNNYCTSCGACVQSCTHNNVGWMTRPLAIEAVSQGRPHWDEAWFVLTLLALTSFHGFTMLPAWEQSISKIAYLIRDSDRLLSSFSIALALAIIVPVVFYAGAVSLVLKITKSTVSLKRLFSAFAFISLPLAFAYHLAHNLNHLVRESVGIGSTLVNPLGIGTQPLSMAEQHARHMDMLISPNIIFFVQAALMAFGFWLAVRIVRTRSVNLSENGITIQTWQLWPLLIFIIVVTVFNLWLLAQPMIMRM